MHILALWLVVLMLAPGAVPVAQTPASAELLYTRVVEASRVMRIVARIANDGDRTLEGVQTRWDAYDASGALVGSQTTLHPPLAAGQAYLYVGGAGSLNLSGLPQTVRLTVSDPGRQSDAPSGLLSVDTVTVAPVPDSVARTPGVNTPGAFTVAFNVTTGGIEVAKRDLVADAALRDAGGQIVAADFETGAGAGTFRGVPDTIAPNTRFRVEMTFRDVSPAPEAAEVAVYVRRR